MGWSELETLQKKLEYILLMVLDSLRWYSELLSLFQCPVLFKTCDVLFRDHSKFKFQDGHEVQLHTVTDQFAIKKTESNFSISK